jgi:hypothetical protein
VLTRKDVLTRKGMSTRKGSVDEKRRVVVGLTKGVSTRKRHVNEKRRNQAVGSGELGTVAWETGTRNCCIENWVVRYGAVRAVAVGTRMAGAGRWLSGGDGRLVGTGRQLEPGSWNRVLVAGTVSHMVLVSTVSVLVLLLVAVLISDLEEAALSQMTGDKGHTKCNQRGTEQVIK